MYDKKNLPISEAHMPSRNQLLKIAGISLLLFCTTSQIAVADSYEKMLSQPHSRVKQRK